MGQQVSIKSVVILLGGHGTRMMPVSMTIPKPFLPVGNKILVQHAIDEAKEAGYNHFIFVVNNDPLMVQLLNRHLIFDSKVEFLLEKKNMRIELEHVRKCKISKNQFIVVRNQEATGMWDAIVSAKEYILSERFAIICPDDLMYPYGCGIPELDKYDYDFLFLAEKCKEVDLEKFGIIEPKRILVDRKLMTVNCIVEKPNRNEAPSKFAATGRYIVSKSIFNVVQIKKLKNTFKEVGMSHVLDSLCSLYEVYAAITIGRRLDCGNPKGLMYANWVHYNDLDGLEVITT